MDTDHLDGMSVAKVQELLLDAAALLSGTDDVVLALRRTNHGVIAFIATGSAVTRAAAMAEAGGCDETDAARALLARVRADVGVVLKNRDLELESLRAFCAEVPAG